MLVKVFHFLIKIEILQLKRITSIANHIRRTISNDKVCLTTETNLLQILMKKFRKRKFEQEILQDKH